MHLWLFYCVLVLLFIYLLKKPLYQHMATLNVYTSKKNLPFFGDARYLFGDPGNIMNMMMETSKECSEKGGLTKLWQGPFLFFFCTDPVKAEALLKHHLEKDDMIKVLRTLTGNGSLFAPVPIWKPRRKVMVSALHPKFVANFFSIFLNRSQKLVDEIAPTVSSKTPVKIWPYLNSYNFDVTLEAGMGEKEFLPEDKEIVLNSMSQLKDYLTKRIFQFWQTPDFLFRFHPNHIKVDSLRKIVFSILDKGVNKKTSEVLNEDTLLQNKLSIFDLFVAFSRRDVEYNEVELREEVITLVSAATDTCSNVLEFVLILLAKYPVVQEKVYEELHTEFHEQNMLPKTREDLSKLKYLERVINEALRLYPPAPFVLRKTKRQTTFSDGIVIPEDASILVSLWGLHRNKKHWGPDADCFDPDRFLPERYSRVPPGCFIPFLSGSRNCPGFAFAMMSVKTVLSVLLKTYRVKPDAENGPIPQIKLNYDITITAVDSKIAFEKRSL
ncbi:cytochrome P450 4C1-like [Colias croceus]|uniref:cytochrome P450 4C1-like n=1 Tax=Colias crocea TaxID=72248 RepID=UPI001E280D68|nr:cytochrome P450 4C1-like [Colias croceus]